MVKREITLGGNDIYGKSHRPHHCMDDIFRQGGMPAVLAEAKKILENTDIKAPGDEPFFYMTCQKEDGNIVHKVPNQLQFHRILGISPAGFPDGVSPYDAKAYPHTAAGIAKLFYDSVAKGHILYNHSREITMYFDGRRWSRDDKEKTHYIKLRDKFIAMMYNAADCIDGDKEYKQSFLKMVGKIEKPNSAIQASLLSIITIDEEDLDKNPDEINLLNGVYNLETGEFREGHRPEDMMSMLAGVAYDPNAKCPRWDRFIQEIFPGEPEKSDFAQKWFGYCLSGRMLTQSMLMCWGPSGRNGKGTFAETIHTLLGDYAMASDYHLIHDNIKSNSNCDEKARLSGKRFLSISEIPVRKSINAHAVKSLVGGDTQRAMRKYEAPFEFHNVAKITVWPNDKPRINDRTMFTSERILLLVFRKHFSASERDEWLQDTLAKPESLSGIFNWLAAGYRIYRDSGYKFNEPDVMKRDLAEYFEEDDAIVSFLKDAFVEDGSSKLSGTAVYTEYREFCERNGFVPMGRNEFYKDLRARDLLRRTSNCDNALIGFRLRQPGEQRIYSARMDMGMAARISKQPKAKIEETTEDDYAQEEIPI